MKLLLDGQLVATMALSNVPLILGLGGSDRALGRGEGERLLRLAEEPDKLLAGEEFSSSSL